MLHHHVINKDYTHYFVAKNLLQALKFSKNSFFGQANHFINMWCLYFPSEHYRFGVFYYLNSFKTNSVVAYFIFCTEMERVPSVVSLFSGAGWSEREIWESFGIFFKNHPNLHHLLLNYGFVGFPLRKSYPISGYKEAIFTDTVRKIVNYKIQLVQELRDNEYIGSWEK